MQKGVASKATAVRRHGVEQQEAHSGAAYWICPEHGRKQSAASSCLSFWSGGNDCSQWASAKYVSFSLRRWMYTYSSSKSFVLSQAGHLRVLKALKPSHVFVRFVRFFFVFFSPNNWDEAETEAGWLFSSEINCLFLFQAPAPMAFPMTTPQVPVYGMVSIAQKKWLSSYLVMLLYQDVCRSQQVKFKTF